METCWTVIHEAARGDAEAQSVFAHTYLDLVRGYLGARWRGSRLVAQMDDAVQDVFLDCFRAQGALGRVDPGRQAGFRTFLYGVVRNVARRVEERAGRRREDSVSSTFDPPADAEPVSVAWDRAWARALLARAGERQRSWAEADGDSGRRRLEILRLRFAEGLPVREIAARLGEEPHVLHGEYRRAREEFKRALREEVSFHHPGPAPAIEIECEKLLALLS